MNPDALKPNNLENQEKEKQKKFVEDTLNLYDGTSQDRLYYLFKDAEMSAQNRAAYEILKKYETNPETTIKLYQIHKSDTHSGGLSVNLETISKDIWIPEKLLKDDKMWQKSFDIFNQDEYNGLSVFKDFYLSEDWRIMKQVLYCEDENRKKIGEKIDLFLNNPDWRNLAKKYCIMRLNRINRFANELSNKTASENQISTFSRGKEEYSQREKDCLKAIDLITKIYLSEMK
ncbi:MAG: hypothetical protein WC662_01675 [Candidatus Paceibacterota bacterium]|jgi:hypothetical protein